MICPNCGTSLPDGTGFCPECGSPVNPSGASYTGDEPEPLTGSARNAQHENAESNTKIGIAVTVVVAALVVIAIICAIIFVPGIIKSITDAVH